MTQEELVQLEREYDAATKVYNDLSEKLKAARSEMYLKDAGIKIGDIVLYRGTKYKVQGVDPWLRSAGWLQGYRILKSGAISTNLTCLYNDWTKEI